MDYYNKYNKKDYLKNNMCKFTPLFDIDYTKKKNIICISLFKMSNSGYKNFDEYINGLENLCQKINLKDINFSIRLFIDNSIFNDKKLLQKLQKLKLEIVIYSCINYLVDTEHHYGTFGTFIRFFPMFDFPNNDANLVIVQDADFDDFCESMLNKMITLINKLDLDNNNLFYVLKITNIINSITPCRLYKNVILGYSLAVSLLGINKINYQVLFDFIESIKNNKIYTDNRLKEKKYLNQYKNIDKFNYGLDEYFINNNLIEYIINNKLPFINIISDFNLYTKIYRYYKWHDKKNILQKKILNKVFTLILDKLNIDNKNLSLKTKFDIIDNFFYNRNTKKFNDNKTTMQIQKIIYKIFLSTYKNKFYETLFPDVYYKILLTKKLFGLYNFENIIFEFSNIKDKFIIKKSFDKNYIDHLIKNAEIQNIKIL
jgi:hypothetical protein